MHLRHNGPALVLRFSAPPSLSVSLALFLLVRGLMDTATATSKLISREREGRAGPASAVNFALGDPEANSRLIRNLRVRGAAC